MKKPIAKIALWTNRILVLLLIGLIFFLPSILRWYCTFRVLTETEQLAITVAYYACVAVVVFALWNVDRLLTNILSARVFTRKNVLRIRRIVRCCALVSLICIPAAFAYMPLIFMVIVMAFLCLMVSVVAEVMNAAVTIREENDLTV